MRKNEKIFAFSDGSVYVGERFLGTLNGKTLRIENHFHISPKKCKELARKYTISNPNCYFKEALEEA